MSNLAVKIDNKKSGEIVQFPKLTKAGKRKMTPNNNTRNEKFVHPIEKMEDVQNCIKFLENEIYKSSNNCCQRNIAARNWLLFIIGTNVGLRAIDLLQLTWDDFFEDDMKTFRTSANVKEKKTGKQKTVCPNQVMKNAVNKYLEITGIVPKYGEYVFVKFHRDGKVINETLSKTTLTNLLKDKLDPVIGYTKRNYNTHTLRKTYAYHMYMYIANSEGPNMALPYVQKCLNHRNSQTTLNYLGIDRKLKEKVSEGFSEYLFGEV